MNIRLDYLSGPILGHKRRCEILEQTLKDRGHNINADGIPDWLIVDYPKEQIPERQPCKNRLIMGALPQERGDWAWHPLLAPSDRVLTGLPWLILDPKMIQYPKTAKKDEILVTCGGADPHHLTEDIMKILNPDAVVLGPQFHRPLLVFSDTTIYPGPSYEQMMMILSSYRNIVCSWGTTVFESLYFGANVFPIVLNRDHEYEAERLGIAFLRKEEIERLPLLIDTFGGKMMVSPTIDLLGAVRLCSFLESFVNERTSD